MTKYTVASSRRGPGPAEQQVAPIWRGVGCVMMIIVPIFSYLIASVVVNFAADQGYAMPYQLMGYPVMPQALYQSGLAPIAAFLAGRENLYAILTLTVLLIVL